jgi:TolA-binding protein
MGKMGVFVAVLFGLCVQLSAQEAELYTEAESRYGRQQYAFALALYDEFLARYPLSERVADVQYRRAVSLFRLERYQEALDLLSLVEKRYRSTSSLGYVPFWQGVTLYHLGDYTRAIDALRAYLKGPVDAELARQALIYKAVAEVSTDRLQDARSTLAELDVSGASVGGYAAVLRSYVLLLEERYDELIALSEGVDASSFEAPWRDRFILYRAEALWETGKTEPAVVLYRRLLDTQAETASVAVRRLFVEASRRNDVTTMEDLVQLAETKFAASPEILKDMWVRLGVENFQRGSLDLAESLLRRVWNLREREKVGSVVALHLAEIYLKGGDRERAAKVLDESLALAQEPTGPVLMRLGDLALAADDHAGAERWYSRFIAENPSDARHGEAVYLRAYARYRTGNYAAALEDTLSYLSSEGDGRFRRDADKLRVVLLKRLDRREEALEALQAFVERYPEDARARLDLLKLLFALQRYPDLVTQADALFRSASSLDHSDPYAYLLSRYLQGLGLVWARKYEEAERSFAAVSELEARRQGLEGVLPDLLYYHGWALYRLSRFAEATAQFLASANGYPDHAGFPRAAYMAGLSSYSGGRFREAAEAFRRVGDARGDASMAARAAYYVGRSLLGAGDRAGALAAMESFIAKYPASELADDALLDYGVTLAEAGQVDRSVAALSRLPKDYPASPLAEEATYQKAQVLFRAARWASARDAYTDFRNSYPRSSLYDAALYWGGRASLETGEKLGAQLLWENKLVKDYPTSPFRADALRRSAEMAADAGDYEKALRLTMQLITDHPEQARAYGSEARASELRYLILGLDRREAELSALVERERGVSSRAGRQAMIALARLYLSGDGRKLDLAYQLLAQIVDRAATDERGTADTAQFLVGEYFYRKNDPTRARDEFLKAALRNPADSELAASSLFRAAEMSALTGRRDDVAALVKRLRDGFPSSPWTQEAKRLLEDGR